jgi:hypothetical protein
MNSNGSIRLQHRIFLCLRNVCLSQLFFDGKKPRILNVIRWQLLERPHERIVHPKSCVRCTLHSSNLGAWRLGVEPRADPRLLAHPPGCVLFFSVYRGCRYAQPPAICCHASGMKNSPFTAKWGGSRNLFEFTKLVRGVECKPSLGTRCFVGS